MDIRNFLEELKEIIGNKCCSLWYYSMKQGCSWNFYSVIRYLWSTVSMQWDSTGDINTLKPKFLQWTAYCLVMKMDIKPVIISQNIIWQSRDVTGCVIEVYCTSRSMARRVRGVLTDHKQVHRETSTVI